METLKQAFENKYPAYAKRILSTFEKANNCEATWENITKINLDKFVKKLQKEVARSSSKVYCAQFKSVLNLYSDEVDLPKGFAEMLSIKNDRSQNVFLTDKEIQRLIDYVPISDSERLIRNQFVLSCLCGARHSDVVMLTEENIFGTTLRYVSRKTRIEAQIPIAPAVKRIIKENEAYGFVGQEYSLTAYNYIIREICKKVGINEKIKLYQGGRYVEGEKWEYVASHTARRSFASNLFLQGIDIYLISKMMGHVGGIQQTEKYICVPLTSVSIELKSYMSKFA